MHIPPQGFRHAAVLLLRRCVRTLPVDAAPETIHDALVHVAHELAALADDMRARPESADWLIAEFGTTVDRLPQPLDREAALSAGAAVLAQVASRTSNAERRDLFLVYVPEDRLPIAAPLAVELTKRRVKVALADFEVETPEELALAIEDGLSRHRGGVVLGTRSFERAALAVPRPSNDRIRVVHDLEIPSAVPALVEWAAQLRRDDPD